MEVVLALLITLALIILFGIGYIVGGKQQIKQIKKDGGYYDTEITGAVYPYKTASFDDEVPKEFLMGGDMEKTLHIAGVKEASLDKQIEWANERKAQYEEKSALNDEQLMKYINEKNEDLLIKAGIKTNTNPVVTKMVEAKETAITLADIATPKGYNQLVAEKMKIEARRKEYQKERENRIKIDFEALNFSRISNEARKKITEIVKQDLEVMLLEVEKNTPEINDVFDGKIDLTNELKPKRTPIGKKRKPKSVNDWENEFDLGGHE